MRRRSTSEKGKEEEEGSFLGVVGLTHLRDGTSFFITEASSDLTKASPATTITTNLEVPICIYSQYVHTDVTHGLPDREEGKTKRGVPLRWAPPRGALPISISWQ